MQLIDGMPAHDVLPPEPLGSRIGEMSRRIVQFLTLQGPAWGGVDEHLNSGDWHQIYRMLDAENPLTMVTASVRPGGLFHLPVPHEPTHAERFG